MSDLQRLVAAAVPATTAHTEALARIYGFESADVLNEAIRDRFNTFTEVQQVQAFIAQRVLRGQRLLREDPLFVREKDNPIAEVHSGGKRPFLFRLVAIAFAKELSADYARSQYLGFRQITTRAWMGLGDPPEAPTKEQNWPRDQIEDARALVKEQIFALEDFDPAPARDKFVEYADDVIAREDTASFLTAMAFQRLRVFASERFTEEEYLDVEAALLAQQKKDEVQPVTDEILAVIDTLSKEIAQEETFERTVKRLRELGLKGTLQLTRDEINAAVDLTYDMQLAGESVKLGEVLVKTVRTDPKERKPLKTELTKKEKVELGEGGEESESEEEEEEEGSESEEEEEDEPVSETEEEEEEEEEDDFDELITKREQELLELAENTEIAIRDIVEDLDAAAKRLPSSSVLRSLLDSPTAAITDEDSDLVDDYGKHFNAIRGRGTAKSDEYAALVKLVQKFSLARIVSLQLELLEDRRRNMDVDLTDSTRTRLEDQMDARDLPSLMGQALGADAQEMLLTLDVPQKRETWRQPDTAYEDAEGNVSAEMAAQKAADEAAYAAETQERAVGLPVFLETVASLRKDLTEEREELRDAILLLIEGHDRHETDQGLLDEAKALEDAAKKIAKRIEASGKQEAAKAEAAYPWAAAESEKLTPEQKRQLEAEIEEIAVRGDVLLDPLDVVSRGAGQKLIVLADKLADVLEFIWDRDAQQDLIVSDQIRLVVLRLLTLAARLGAVSPSFVDPRSVVALEAADDDDDDDDEGEYDPSEDPGEVDENDLFVFVERLRKLHNPGEALDPVVFKDIDPKRGRVDVAAENRKRLKKKPPQPKLTEAEIQALETADQSAFRKEVLVAAWHNLEDRLNRDETRLEVLPKTLDELADGVIRLDRILQGDDPSEEEEEEAQGTVAPQAEVTPYQAFVKDYSDKLVGNLVALAGFLDQELRTPVDTPREIGGTEEHLRVLYKIIGGEDDPTNIDLEFKPPGKAVKTPLASAVPAKKAQTMPNLVSLFRAQRSEQVESMNKKLNALDDTLLDFDWDQLEIVFTNYRAPDEGPEDPEVVNLIADLADFASAKGRRYGGIFRASARGTAEWALFLAYLTTTFGVAEDDAVQPPVRLPEDVVAKFWDAQNLWLNGKIDDDTDVNTRIKARQRLADLNVLLERVRLQNDAKTVAEVDDLLLNSESLGVGLKAIHKLLVQRTKEETGRELVDLPSKEELDSVEPFINVAINWKKAKVNDGIDLYYPEEEEEEGGGKAEADAALIANVLALTGGDHRAAVKLLRAASLFA